MSEDDYFYKTIFPMQFLTIKHEGENRQCYFNDIFNLRILSSSDIIVAEILCLKDRPPDVKYDLIGKFEIKSDEIIHIPKLSCEIFPSNFENYWRHVCYYWAQEGFFEMNDREDPDSAVNARRAFLIMHSILFQMIKIEQKNGKYYIIFRRPIFPYPSSQDVIQFSNRRPR